MIILSGAGTVTGGSITDPSDLDDIWEWWEPSRESFSDNDPIGQLTGQHAPGSGHNWTQSNATLKPTYKSAIVNGHGVVRWDGTDDEMSGVDPSALTAIHFFCVIKMDSNTPASGKSGVWQFGTTGGSVYPRPDGGFTQITDGSFRGSQQTFLKSGIDVSQWRVVEVVSTSSEWTYTLDGTLLRTDPTAFAIAGASQIRFGRSGPTDGSYLDGDVAGMYIFSAKLNSGDRAAMIDYLNNRFGTTAT